MTKREAFLIRLDPNVLAAIRGWSEDEMRSINGQIEYLLRQSLRSAGRLPDRTSPRKSKKSKQTPPDESTQDDSKPSEASD